MWPLFFLDISILHLFGKIYLRYDSVLGPKIRQLVGCRPLNWVLQSELLSCYSELTISNISVYNIPDDLEKFMIIQCTCSM